MKSQIVCCDSFSFFSFFSRVAAKFVFCWLCLFQMTGGNKHTMCMQLISQAAEPSFNTLRRQFKQYWTLLQLVIHTAYEFCADTQSRFSHSLSLSLYPFCCCSLPCEHRTKQQRASVLVLDIVLIRRSIFPAFRRSQYVANHANAFPHNNNNNNSRSSDNNSSSNDTRSSIHWCEIHAIFVSMAMYMLVCVHVFACF